MAKLMAKEVVLWNRFVRALFAAEKHWAALQEVMCERTSKEIELLGEQAQRFLSKNFIKSRFVIMLPRLVDYWRSIGGLQELEIKSKEDRNNDRTK